MNFLKNLAPYIFKLKIFISNMDVNLKKSNNILPLKIIVRTFQLQTFNSKYCFLMYSFQWNFFLFLIFDELLQITMMLQNPNFMCLDTYGCLRW